MRMFLKGSKWLRLLSASMTLAVCGCTSKNSSAPSTAQSVASAGSGYTCSFTETDQFSIGTDPTQDFSIAGFQETPEITNSTCTGLSNGIQANESFVSATSASHHITLNSSNGSNDIYLSGATATTPNSELVTCESGVLITGTLQEVELDAVADQIRVTISWSLVNNNCAPMTTSGASAPAPVVTDLFTVPSSISSSPSYLYLESDPGLSNSTFQIWAYSSSGSLIAFDPVDGGLEFNIQQNSNLDWTVGFWAGNGATLLPGLYENIIQFGGVPPSNPSIELIGFGTQYLVQSGSSFQVQSASYDSSGNLLTLLSNFSIVTDSSTGAMIRGVINYTSPQ